MTTRPNENNEYAIPGAAINAKPKQAQVVIPVAEDKSLAGLFSRAVSIIDWNLSNVTDTQRATKYRYDPEVNYYANGSLSILARTGNLVFSKNLNEANQAAFKLDQSGSHLFSSAATTTLGSSVIDTLDGLVMNPLSSIFPSAPFVPVKTWLQQLFPALSTKNLVGITILELVQAYIFKSINKDSTNINDRFIEKDLGTIIIDNEDKFL